MRTGQRTRSRLTLALAALAIAGCSGEPSGRDATDSPPPAPALVKQSDGTEVLVLEPGAVPGMSLTTAKEVELARMLETSGQVSFDDRRVATIISRVAGRVEDVRVSQWDTVQRGQPIVAMYSPDYMTAEAEYLQAQTTAKLSGTPGLSDDGGLAAAMVAAARRKLELLGLEGADIKAITTPSATQVVRAPISGTVVEKQVVRGSQVNPGDVLFTLGTLEDVWITGDIYEDDLARVHVGQELEALPVAFPDQVFKGTISRISPNIDPNTHTLQLRCQVHNPDLRLKPQMLVRVRIVTAPGVALVVPQEALVFETDGYYAFVEIEANRLTRRRVSIASWNEAGYARVVAGLSAGERVVQRESLQVNALWQQAHGESS